MARPTPANSPASPTATSPTSATQISTEPTRILSGQRIRRFESIDGSGATRDAEWLIQGSAGEQVTLELRSDVFGTRAQTITLTTREDAR